MSPRPWMKFYPSDWRSDPGLRMCSLAARGLWIELLTYMHEADPYGFLVIAGAAPDDKKLAKLVGIRVQVLRKLCAELEHFGVFSRTENGTIYSRRMVRDFAKAARDTDNGTHGGHPEIRRGTVPKDQRVRRFRRSDAPAKAQRIFDRSAGHCHWCQIKLAPDHYHIDHVIAVRDGGTNDENNLVASCPDCNGERAMTWSRSDADLMVGNESDPKAHMLEARIQKEESPHTPRKRGTRSLSKTEEAEFESWWETYPHKVGKAAARSAWHSARGKAGLDDLLAGVARYVATKPPDRPWANPSTWLNQERWADQPAGTTPPVRTAAEREASNVLTFEDIYDRRQAALLARVERWIAGEEWDERCESIRPDKGLINLPDRLLDQMRADIERRGAECQAADNKALWDANRAWVRKKAAAGEDPAPQVFDRLRDDAAAHKQFGCTREGLRQFIVETCAKAGLATAAEGMSFSPPAQQQGAAR